MVTTGNLKLLNILNLEPLGYCDEAADLLAELGRVRAKQMSRSQLIKELGDYEVLIVRLAHQIDQEIINAGRRLRVIVTATTGLDHIDVEYASKRGITVLSLRGETEFLHEIWATAEHTWTLLLALLRKIVPASIAALDGKWDRDRFRGHELHGRRLGIVGLGRLGEKVARYGQVFGMSVSAFDPFVGQWVDGVRRVATLNDLLQASDILTLHVPLNTQTQGMIRANELAMLPTGAVLVNTSRGQLIDEFALITCLESKQLSGAALDVVAFERDAVNRSKSPLFAYARNHDNLLITPHIGGATYESMAQTEIFMAHKLRKFILSIAKDSR
jgi:D-3-phosphoglycerate dehydrogenase